VAYAKRYFSETIRERNNPHARLKTVSMETKEILSELNKEYKPVKISENDETSLQKADKFNAVRTIIYE
jgi:peptidyl-prolyl cis-trans isomerase-like protein 2